MKNLIFTLLVMGVAPITAHAGFFDALADVTSFGWVSYERDRTRAEMNRILALEKQLAAEQEKHRQIENLLEQNAIVGANLAANTEILKALNLLQTLIESQKKFMAFAIELLINSNAELSGIAQLVQLQQNDLAEFIEAYLKSDPDNRGLLAALEKTGSFQEQIENFPMSDWDDLSISGLVIEAFANTNEIKEIMGSTILLVQTRIKDQQETIARNKKREQELKKKPRPSGGIRVTCPRMYPRPGGGYTCEIEP